jgi:hypothetical protein
MQCNGVFAAATKDQKSKRTSAGDGEDDAKVLAGGGFPGVAELGVRTQEPPTPSEQEESGPTTGRRTGGAQGRPAL